MDRHIIGMLVEDKPGIMTRISGMFARRGFNIDTITVGKTSTPGISRVIFSIRGDDSILEQVAKQVNKLVDVIKVSQFKPEDSIIAELAYIKVSVRNDKAKQDLLRMADIYKVKIKDISPKSIIFEMAGTAEKVDSFIENVKGHGIREMSRTGVTAMIRGQKVLGDKT